MNNESGVFAEAHRLEERGEAFAFAFIIKSQGSVPRNSGRMIVHADGSTVGTVGGGSLEAQVIKEAMEALGEGRSRTVRRELTGKGGEADEMVCGGTVEVRIDVSGAPPRLVLMGGGHISLAVARLAASLGFSVEVIESRPEFCSSERFPMARAFYLRDDISDAADEVRVDGNCYVVIVTHSHEDDIRTLARLAGSGAAYIGMMGSKRKTAIAVAKLRELNVPESVIASLRAPIGLDIGAQTPEEIAVSIMAEILMVRGGRSGLPLQGMTKDLAVVRGGGDLATGVAWRLRRCGFRVMILEVPKPTVIRRTVAFAEAVNRGSVVIEGIKARSAADIAGAYEILESGDIPVLADPEARSLDVLRPAVLVDATLAKRNLGTRRDMAPVVVALGPGFTAGPEGDCHAVVETARGHELGRVILDGPAAPNTGTPGLIAGKAAERVLRAPMDGIFEEAAALGDLVKEGQVVARVRSGNTAADITAPFDGKLRGLLTSGIEVTQGFKVGDVDPRGAQVNEHLISDKARAVAGGVLEAVLMLRVHAESGSGRRSS